MADPHHAVDAILMELIASGGERRLAADDPALGSDPAAAIGHLAHLARLRLPLPRPRSTPGLIVIRDGGMEHRIGLEIDPGNAGCRLALNASLEADAAHRVPALPPRIADALPALLDPDAAPPSDLFRRHRPRCSLERPAARLLKRLTFRSQTMRVMTHLGVMTQGELEHDSPAARLAAMLIEQARQLGTPWLEFRYDGRWEVLAAGGEVLMSPPDRLYPAVFAWLAQLELGGEVEIQLAPGCLCRIHLVESAADA